MVSPGSSPGPGPDLINSIPDFVLVRLQIIFFIFYQANPDPSLDFTNARRKKLVVVLTMEANLCQKSRHANKIQFNCKHVFVLTQRYKYVNPNCRMLKSTFQNVGLFYFNLYICNSSNVNLH